MWLHFTGKNKVSLVFEYIKKDEYNPELEAALKSLTATLDTNNYIQVCKL